MQKLASNLANVLTSIKRLNDSLPNYPDLADRLGHAHAFYVFEQEDDKPLFGFSKFVGYDSLTPEQYLTDYKSLDGRNTEQVLSRWFEELRHGSPTYEARFEQLSNWMAQFGKRPRSGGKQQVRLMTVRPEFQQKVNPKIEDRRLLDLLMAVADTLSTNQRHILRGSL